MTRTSQLIEAPFLSIPIPGYVCGALAAAGASCSGICMACGGSCVKNGAICGSCGGSGR